jgi:hypothetical protein
MTGKLTWALALASLLAIQTLPASACKVVGHTKSGEPLCMQTSDGAGQVYKKADGPIFVPDRPIFVPNKPKAVQAMEIAKAKANSIAVLKRIRWSHN